MFWREARRQRLSRAEELVSLHHKIVMDGQMLNLLTRHCGHSQVCASKSQEKCSKCTHSDPESFFRARDPIVFIGGSK